MSEKEFVSNGIAQVCLERYDELKEYEFQVKNGLNKSTAEKKLDDLQQTLSDYLDDECEFDMEHFGKIMAPTVQMVEKFADKIGYIHDKDREAEALRKYRESEFTAKYSVGGRA